MQLCEAQLSEAQLAETRLGKHAETTSGSEIFPGLDRANEVINTLKHATDPALRGAQATLLETLSAFNKSIEQFQASMEKPRKQQRQGGMLAPRILQFRPLGRAVVEVLQETLILRTSLRPKARLKFLKL